MPLSHANFFGFVDVDVSSRWELDKSYVSLSTGSDRDDLFPLSAWRLSGPNSAAEAAGGAE
jgi:hypothetical protein